MARRSPNPISMYVTNVPAQKERPPSILARRRRPPMARIPASEIIMAKEHGLKPSTIPARTTAGSVSERRACGSVVELAPYTMPVASASSTLSPTTLGLVLRTLPTSARENTGLPGSSETTVIVLRKGPGLAPVVTETLSSAAAEGGISSADIDAFAPQHVRTRTMRTGTGPVFSTLTVRSDVSTGPRSPKSHSS